MTKPQMTVVLNSDILHEERFHNGVILPGHIEPQIGARPPCVPLISALQALNGASKVLDDRIRPKLNHI